MTKEDNNLEIWKSTALLAKSNSKSDSYRKQTKPDGKLYSRAHCADAILSKSGSTDVKLACLSQKLFCNY